MATSSIGSTAGSAASNTSNIVSALGAGSGIDIKSLAQNLVNVEKQPRADAITKKITKEEGRISGIAAINGAIKKISDSFESIRSAKAFGAIQGSLDRSDLLSAEIDSTAKPGNYKIIVKALAQEQRVVATFENDKVSVDPLASTNPPVADLNQDLTLNFVYNAGGSSKNIILTIPPKLESTNGNTPRERTPQDIVDSINNASSLKLPAGPGISAQLINTGNCVKIVLSGPQGMPGNFSVSSNVRSTVGLMGNLGDAERTLGAVNPYDPFDQTAIAHDDTGEQQSQSSEVIINGIPITRPTNSVTDAIPGVTLSLTKADASAITSISLTTNKSSIKESLSSFVNAYNEFSDLLNKLGDPKNQDPVYGGLLSGDSILRSTRSAAYTVITDPLVKNPINAVQVNALLDIGIQFDGKSGGGRFKLDENKLNLRLSLAVRITIFLEEA